MSIAGFLIKIRKQEAVYWATPVDDGYGGFTWTAPVEIKCRWEDVSDLFIDENGEQQISNAEVITDRVVTLGGYLWLGDLESSTPNDPMTLENAYKIRKFESIPDIANNVNVMTAIL